MPLLLFNLKSHQSLAHNHPGVPVLRSANLLTHCWLADTHNSNPELPYSFANALTYQPRNFGYCAKILRNIFRNDSMSFSPVHSRSPGRRGPSPGGPREEPPRSTIFVGNLAPDSDEQSLKDFFSKYGYVTQVKVRLVLIAA